MMNIEWIHGRRFKYIACAVGLVLLMTGVYMYTHRNQSGPKAGYVKPAVQTLTMEKKDMMKRVALSGETVPEAQVDISPKYAGRIASVAVNLGDVVSAGDVLLQQDTNDLSIAINENQAGAAAARADAVETRSTYDSGTMKAQTDYQNALDTYNRYESLYEEGAVALQDRDDKYRAMMEAKSALDALANQDMDGSPASIVSKEAAADKAAYAAQALEQQAADMTIRAPRAGMIGYRQVEAGEWVSAGQKVLSIVDNSHIYVDCTVAEQDIGLIRQGMALDVTVDSLGNTYKGVVTFISPAMDAATKNYTVRLSLDTSSGDLRGGLFAHTEADTIQRKDTLFVPKAAVGDENGKKFVYTIDSDNNVTKVYVTLGLVNDTDMEITKGLSVGDQVVVSSIARMRDGMNVDRAPDGGK